MAKLYKVRKKCLICGGVFYPKYAGSLYCEVCKNKKSTETKARAKPAAKKSYRKAAKKTAKKHARKATKKAARKTKSRR
ncbi:hypothetical protein QT06_C0001G0279 [archaeon GW2011_AR15]|nr:hypothetical protein QT06_C0001G0279 [archaeon GW2011_AR15]